MKLFRKLYVRNGFILLMGVVFLNMSFFLLELEALKLANQDKLVEVITKLVVEDILEEESETEGDTSENEVVEKGYVLNYQSFYQYKLNLVSVRYRQGARDKTFATQHHSEITTPPPEAVA